MLDTADQEKRFEEIYEAILEHICAVVRETPTDSNPCIHGILEHFFPQDIYDEILASLPSSDVYRPMNIDLWRDEHGVSTRDVVELPDIGVSRMAPDIRPLWKAIGSALVSEAFKREVFGRLSEDLAPVLGCAPGEVDGRRVFVSVALRTETAAYHLVPHTDHLPRLATMLIYLPKDDSLDGLGTSFYDSAPSWKRLFRPRHREVRRAPFRPNSAVYFSGNDRPKRPGWHGFERPKTLGSDPRVSLLVTWYIDAPDEYRDKPDIMVVRAKPA